MLSRLVVCVADPAPFAVEPRAAPFDLPRTTRDSSSPHPPTSTQGESAVGLTNFWCAREGKGLRRESRDENSQSKTRA